MQLSNDHIQLQIAPHGAELTSFCHHGQELLWQADPAFWKRHAPILFPIVGKVFRGAFRVHGTEYHLPQHGFARDSDFALVESTPSSLTYQLQSSPITLQNYPYQFELTASYQLSSKQLSCAWIVANLSHHIMYFQIGAHPAFNLLSFNPNNLIHGYLRFYHNGTPLSQFTVTQLSPDGHALPDTHLLPLCNNQLPITPTLFTHDALVLEGSQADCVELLDRQGCPYLRMRFDAPVLGIWSPVNAPFCCIEPWYGRTDAEGFAGDISQRQYIQSIQPSEHFTFRYTIEAC